MLPRGDLPSGGWGGGGLPSGGVVFLPPNVPPGHTPVKTLPSPLRYTMWSVKCMELITSGSVGGWDATNSFWCPII